MAAYIVYKCRRCCTNYYRGTAPDGHTFINHMIHGILIPESWGVSTFGMTAIHSCTDGGYGVADFIGVSAPIE